MAWVSESSRVSLRLPATAIALVFALSGVNTEAAQINFGDGAAGAGEMVYDPTQDNFLHGNDIKISIAVGIDTPQNSGEYACSNCVLSFTTGGFLGFDDSSNPNRHAFSHVGSSVTITGDIDLPGVPPSNDPTGTLLSGRFNSDVTLLVFPTGNFVVQIGSGVDQKNDDLLAFFFGNSPSPNGWAFVQTVDGLIESTGPDNAISGRVSNTDVINTAVPIPPAVWLFGSALIGLVGMARRRRKI